MRRYKIVIKVGTQRKLDRRVLERACRRLEEEFYIGKSGHQAIEADWWQGFNVKVKRQKERFFIEAKTMVEALRKFKQILAPGYKRDVVVSDNLPENRETIKSQKGGQNASF